MTTARNRLRPRLGLLLWAAAAVLSAWTGTAGAQPAKLVVTVARPAAGETLRIDVPPEVTLALAFSLDDTWQQEHYPDLLLLFEDGARVELRDLLLDAQIASVDITFEGITVPAVALVGQSTAAEPPPAAANGADHGEGDPAGLAGLRHTGRDLLLAGEAERAGHPLYSYLLFAGTRDGAREERLRFEAAIQAYIGQVSSADALEASGAERSKINIFYAPVTFILADAEPDRQREHFAQRSAGEQIALLLEHYDRARAEVLLGRLQLAGNGPFIVSLLRPLSGAAVGADEAFLVQDLSSVPPQLVGLWVDEFKRQVVREATSSPEHLRRLALSLRTQIAVLAEAFAITKTAVAEMFEGPGGSGN